MDKVNAAHVQHAAELTASHPSPKEALASDAIQQEHELTLASVFQNHKKIIWWCFFWAMAAVGW